MSRLTLKNVTFSTTLSQICQVFALVLAMNIGIAQASMMRGNVSLQWDPVADPRVAGYKLYYGLSSGKYSTGTDVGLATTHAFRNLEATTTYYFAVVAYDSERRESGYSNEVSVLTDGYAQHQVIAADFSASATSGVAPFALNFTDASSGEIKSYSWDFGDGTSAVSPNPVKVYKIPGLYTVKLTVAGPSGTNTKVKPDYIRVSTVSDRQPPTDPSALVAVARKRSRIDLRWTGSTDNIGVEHYNVERCKGLNCSLYVQIGTSIAPIYSDRDFGTAETSGSGAQYSYRVRAIDAAGNISNASNISTATLNQADPGQGRRGSNLSSCANSTNYTDAWLASNPSSVSTTPETHLVDMIHQEDRVLISWTGMLKTGAQASQFVAITEKTWNAVYSGPIFQTDGKQLTSVQLGSLTVNFKNGAEGTIKYTLSDSGSMTPIELSLVRQPRPDGRSGCR